MKTSSTERRGNFWNTLRTGALLFCLVLAVPSGWSAPVIDTVTKLVPSDITSNLFFGTSVAIENGLAAVGTPDTTNGAVYTYALVGGNWVQTQKLTDPAPPCGGDKFGTSVAMQDGLLVVGQPEGCSSLGLTGQAFVYRLIGGTWVLEQTLTEIPPQPQSPNFGFGTAVSISGNTIAVSDPENSAGVAIGAISIFTNNGTSWNPQAQIAAPFGNENVRSYGSAITLEGDTLLVGAPLMGEFGAAYVYVRTGTTWTLQQTLTPPVLRSAELFGSAVALEDDTAVVGAPGMTVPPLGGAAFVFNRSGSTWTSTQELEGADGVTNQALGFGTSISISNGIMVVGAPGRIVNGQTNAGGADIFQFNGTSWVLVQQIAAPDASSGAQFGDAVDIGESGIIVGAPFDSSVKTNGGAAYIFSAAQAISIVSASASPNRLFPPNHKFVPVTVSVTTQGNAVSCKITSVSSNQPINGTGDGNTSPDWVITGDLTVLLRAERAGNIKTDRVYTITVQCVDAFGNTATTAVHVTVPHDNGK